VFFLILMQVFISGLLTKLLHVPFSMRTLWLQDLKKYKLGDPSSFHYLNNQLALKLMESMMLRNILQQEKQWILLASLNKSRFKIPPL
jgi:hypothetical protein